LEARHNTKLFDRVGRRIELTEAGTAELGFVEGAVANEHLASTPIARDQLVIVVGPEHLCVPKTQTRT
jgi:DNA-binding transcriptional LysR family regulator